MAAYAVLTTVTDQPGLLSRLTKVLADYNANITYVDIINHTDRDAEIYLEFSIERDANALLADLRRTVDAPAVWARQPGGREAVVAWFQAVHDRLVSVGFHAPIMGELGDTVRALAAA